MKKQLSLKTQTVRNLSTTELAAAGGGSKLEFPNLRPPISWSCPQISWDCVPVTQGR